MLPAFLQEKLNRAEPPGADDVNGTGPARRLGCQSRDKRDRRAQSGPRDQSRTTVAMARTTEIGEPAAKLPNTASFAVAQYSPPSIPPMGAGRHAARRLGNSDALIEKRLHVLAQQVGLHLQNLGESSAVIYLSPERVHAAKTRRLSS
jgi:hypothetical protein